MFRKNKVEKYVSKFGLNVLLAILFYPFGTAFAYLLVKLGSEYLVVNPDHHKFLLIKTWVDYLIEYIEKYPNRIFVSSVFIGILITNTRTVFKQRRLLEVCGLNFFSEHASDSRIKADWNYLIREFEKSDTQCIYILGATGFRTFADKNSPLNSFLDKFHGSVFVLLLDPTSPAVASRAENVGMRMSDYRDEINSSIKYLKGYYKKNPLVKLKLYKHQPSWKMIMSDRYLWLQYYQGSVHVDSTVVYGMNRIGHHDYSFYQYSHWQFDRLWDHSKRYELA